MRVRVPRQGLFWLAVGAMAIVADVTCTALADKLGDRVPALKTFNDYRNGKVA